MDLQPSQELLELTQALEKQYEYYMQQNHYFLRYAHILWSHWRNLKHLSELTHRLVYELNNMYEVVLLHRYQKDFLHRSDQDQLLKAQSRLEEQQARELSEAIADVQRQLERLQRPEPIPREQALLEYGYSTGHVAPALAHGIHRSVEELQHELEVLRQKNHKLFEELLSRHLELVNQMIENLEKQMGYIHALNLKFHTLEYQLHAEHERALEQIHAVYHQVINDEQQRLEEALAQYEELKEEYQHSLEQKRQQQASEQALQTSHLRLTPFLLNPWENDYNPYTGQG